MSISRRSTNILYTHPAGGACGCVPVARAGRPVPKELVGVADKVHLDRGRLCHRPLDEDHRPATATRKHCCKPWAPPCVCTAIIACRIAQRKLSAVLSPCISDRLVEVRRGRMPASIGQGCCGAPLTNGCLFALWDDPRTLAGAPNGPDREQTSRIVEIVRLSRGPRYTLKITRSSGQFRSKRSRC